MDHPKLLASASIIDCGNFEWLYSLAAVRSFLSPPIKIVSGPSVTKSVANNLQPDAAFSVKFLRHVSTCS